MTVHLITGSDVVLVGNAASEVVHGLVGDGDRTLMVDEFDPVQDEVHVAQIIDAAQTPPFLTDHRVVVVRDAGALPSDEMGPLVAYLADPLPTTELVLVAGGGRLPKALTDAVKAAGGQVITADAPAKKAQLAGWVDEQISNARLRFDRAASAAVVGWLGEEPGRLHGLLETLVAAYGEGAKLGAEDVTPFLGQAGGVPPWDLTDAIDRGDTAGALTLLHRMMHAGGRHPLAIMAILHGHYVRLLRLDGAGANSQSDAIEALGLKPPQGFIAQKALNQYRALGSSGVTRAIALLASADLDLRGDKDWPPELVAEVLVARLSRLVVSPARR